MSAYNAYDVSYCEFWCDQSIISRTAVSETTNAEGRCSDWAKYMRLGFRFIVLLAPCLCVSLTVAFHHKVLFSSDLADLACITLIVTWSSPGGRIKCCTSSVCPSVQCLWFSWNRNAVETSNLVKFSAGQH